ncbi:MAG: cobyrinate a,c-diamide synthase [Candidatus Parabeggiatoa sp. nov. 3]|nr:MAG: cobyrinate a,c-diamide synthase [Gammaproteobacteria bacterium]
MQKPQFLIAAPASNTGKTTVTLALLRALSQQGFRVQPYKCGPDYLDPFHHTRAAGRQSINLDTFMASESYVQDIYRQYLSDADIAILEGVMGLFDGAQKMQGSSAEIAILLNIPVILVINAKAMAYSVAPLIYGFKHFDKRLKIKGVIFNYVNTASHYQFLKEACEEVGVEALGYIPKNDKLQIPSRHLGLYISDEIDYDNVINTAASHVSEHVDIKRVLSITETAFLPLRSQPLACPKKRLKIVVAQDAAFNFIYSENLQKLSEYGEVIFFSPLSDKQLPEGDFLYLAGGYPELFLESLSHNHSLKASILNYCQKGGLTYAECGGMMYLGQTITNEEGQAFEMVNFLDLTTSMANKRLHLGYRKIQFNDFEIRGHEFHYSSVTVLREMQTLGKIYNAKGLAVSSSLYRKQNTFASYIHVYWGEQDEFLKKLTLF